MDKDESRLLVQVFMELIEANSKIDALISMKLDIVERGEFTEIVTRLRKDRLLELLEYGFLSDEDEDFLRSEFD